MQTTTLLLSDIFARIVPLHREITVSQHAKDILLNFGLNTTISASNSAGEIDRLERAYGNLMAYYKEYSEVLIDPEDYKKNYGPQGRFWNILVNITGPITDQFGRVLSVEEHTSEAITKIVAEESKAIATEYGTLGLSVVSNLYRKNTDAPQVYFWTFQRHARSPDVVAEPENEEEDTQDADKKDHALRRQILGITDPSKGVPTNTAAGDEVFVSPEMFGRPADATLEAMNWLANMQSAAGGIGVSGGGGGGGVPSMHNPITVDVQSRLESVSAQRNLKDKIDALAGVSDVEFVPGTGLINLEKQYFQKRHLLNILDVQMEIFAQIRKNLKYYHQWERNVALVLNDVVNAHTGRYTLYTLDNKVVRQRNAKDKRAWQKALVVDLYVRNISEHYTGVEHDRMHLQINPLVSHGFMDRYRYLRRSIPSASAHDTTLDALNWRIAQYVHYLEKTKTEGVLIETVPYVLDPELLFYTDAKTAVELALKKKLPIQVFQSLEETIAQQDQLLKELEDLDKREKILGESKATREERRKLRNAELEKKDETDTLYIFHRLVIYQLDDNTRSAVVQSLKLLLGLNSPQEQALLDDMRILFDEKKRNKDAKEETESQRQRKEDSLLQKLLDVLQEKEKATKDPTREKIIMYIRDLLLEANDDEGFNNAEEIEKRKKIYDQVSADKKRNEAKRNQIVQTLPNNDVPSEASNPKGISTIASFDFQDLRRNYMLRLAINASNALAGINSNKHPGNAGWLMAGGLAKEYASWSAVAKQLDNTLFFDIDEPGASFSTRAEHPFYTIFQALVLEYNVKYLLPCDRDLDFVLSTGSTGDGRDMNRNFADAMHAQLANHNIMKIRDNGTARSTMKKIRDLQNTQRAAQGGVIQSTVGANPHADAIAALLQKLPPQFDMARILTKTNGQPSDQYQVLQNSTHNVRALRSRYGVTSRASVTMPFQTLLLANLSREHDVGSYEIQQYNTKTGQYHPRGIHHLDVLDNDIARIKRYSAPTHRAPGAVMSPTSSTGFSSVVINVHNNLADVTASGSGRTDGAGSAIHEKILLPEFQAQIKEAPGVVKTRTVWLFSPYVTMDSIYPSFTQSPYTTRGSFPDRRRYDRRTITRPIWDPSDPMYTDVQTLPTAFGASGYMAPSATPFHNGLYVAVEIAGDQPSALYHVEAVFEVAVSDAIWKQTVPMGTSVRLPLGKIMEITTRAWDNVSVTAVAALYTIAWERARESGQSAPSVDFALSGPSQTFDHVTLANVDEEDGGIYRARLSGEAALVGNAPRLRPMPLHVSLEFEIVVGPPVYPRDDRHSGNLWSLDDVPCARCRAIYREADNYHGACRWHTHRPMLESMLDRNRTYILNDQRITNDNDQYTKNNGQRTPNNGQITTNDSQRTPNIDQRTANNNQRTTNDEYTSTRAIIPITYETTTVLPEYPLLCYGLRKGGGANSGQLPHVLETTGRNEVWRCCNKPLQTAGCWIGRHNRFISDPDLYDTFSTMENNAIARDNVRIYRQAFEAKVALQEHNGLLYAGTTLVPQPRLYIVDDRYKHIERGSEWEMSAYQHDLHTNIIKAMAEGLGTLSASLTTVFYILVNEYKYNAVMGADIEFPWTAFLHACERYFATKGIFVDTMVGTIADNQPIKVTLNNTMKDIVAYMDGTLSADVLWDSRDNTLDYYGIRYSDAERQALGKIARFVAYIMNKFILYTRKYDLKPNQSVPASVDEAYIDISHRQMLPRMRIWNLQPQAAMHNRIADTATMRKIAQVAKAISYVYEYFPGQMAPMPRKTKTKKRREK